MAYIAKIAIAGTTALMMTAPAAAITVNATEDPTTLVNNILGAGVSIVGTPTFTKGAASGFDDGPTIQAGSFTAGTDAVPFASGIVLGTGSVAAIPGANTDSGLPEAIPGGGNDGPGTNDFSANNLTHAVENITDTSATTGITDSRDFAMLEFQFQFGDGSGGGDIFFNFSFASEEYLDFVDSAFNDEFQLLINGVNLGTTTGSVGGDPININSVNPNSNAGLYVNNVQNTEGVPDNNLAFGFDGRTTGITANANALGAGVHTAQFIIADVGDGLLDSGVFIQGGTFANTSTPVADVPAPAALGLLGLGLGLVAARRRRKG
ncbi:MAG: choice-of-anchor L domain-containing protein [Pacificimonas sp.]|jgi:hypothetical protein|nr:choice-of-anchor L domain-containing protein [Pacificimonas sp.]